MNDKNFDIYLEFQYSKLNLAAFDKKSDKLEYNKDQSDTYIAIEKLICEYKIFLQNLL